MLFVEGMHYKPTQESSVFYDANALAFWDASFIKAWQAEFFLNNGIKVTFNELRELINTEQLLGLTQYRGLNILSTWTEKGIRLSNEVQFLGVEGMLDFTYRVEHETRRFNKYKKYWRSKCLDDCVCNLDYCDFVSLHSEALSQVVSKSWSPFSFNRIYSKSVKESNIIDLVVSDPKSVYWLNDNMFCLLRTIVGRASSDDSISLLAYIYGCSDNFRRSICTG